MSYDMQMRDAYEAWCKQHGKRATPSGWDIWRAAYSSGTSMFMPPKEYDALSDAQRSFLRSALEAIRGAK